MLQLDEWHIGVYIERNGNHRETQRVRRAVEQALKRLVKDFGEEMSARPGMPGRCELRIDQ